jgi:hypothetical protein
MAGKAALSDVEIALIDAIKSVSDVVMAMDPHAAGVLATNFAHQRDGKLAKDQPEAAAVFEILRLFVDDPDRKEYRNLVRKAMSERSKGSA